MKTTHVHRLGVPEFLALCVFLALVWFGVDALERIAVYLTGGW